jgi:hypothetical protein
MTDLLMVFAQQTNPYKVALDKSDRIIGVYAKISESNEFAATWLNLMTMKPSSFERITVETDDVANMEELFLRVCSSTKSQQKLIVHSHENWKHYRYDQPTIIIYRDIQVRVYDRDEAIIELNRNDSAIVNAHKSIIATNQSSIIDGKIE